MKRNKALLSTLFLSIGLTLAACGTAQNASAESNDTTNKNAAASEQQETFSIGDTITTDLMEFTLTRIEFGAVLKNATFSTGQKPDEEYLLPLEKESSSTDFVADSGNTFLTYSYTIKYLGKEEMEIPTDMDMVVNYDDGYTFDIEHSAYMWSDYIQLKDTTKLKPLDVAGEGRGYVKVPEAVATEIDKALTITVTIPDEEGTTSEKTYTIR